MLIDPWHLFSAHFGANPMPYTSFVTLLDMFIYFVLFANVGRARREYMVPVPLTDGPEGFQRVLRVQINTAEQLVFHLPLLWVAAIAMSDVFAASLGAVWAFGRILYARGYYQKTQRRMKGFIINLVVNSILFGCALASTYASF